MEEWLTRYIQDFGDRLTGPLHFRFLLQPLMASILAVRAGLQDAREGKPPYFWAIFTDSRWKELVREGWQAIAKVFTIAIVMDVIYQLIELRFVYVLDAVITAVLLAMVPYLLLRGPVNRLVRTSKRPAVPPPSTRGVK
jgi:hypothetical protein